MIIAQALKASNLWTQPWFIRANGRRYQVYYIGKSRRVGTGWLHPSRPSSFFNPDLHRYLGL